MECLQRYLYVATVLAAVLLNTANSYTITVDAHEEQCFFENVEAGTKMGKLVHTLSIEPYNNISKYLFHFECMQT